MSEAEEAPPKKKKKTGLIVIVAIAIIVIGAGTAGGLYAAGAFSSHTEAPKQDPNRPQLVLASEDPEAIAEKFASAGHEAGEGDTVRLPKGGVDLPRPKEVSRYHATYFQMPVPFTSNLTDTDSFVQVSMAISTYYDARVVEALKTHEMAIRSAVLLALAQEAEATLSTPQGKAALQRKLERLINQVLKEKTGYGAVDNVYFTNFVIQ